MKPNPYRYSDIFFRQADLTADAYPEIRSRSIELYYTDPPWNDGNVKMFYTMMRKQTGIDREAPPVAELMHAVFGLATRVLSDTGVLVLECSVFHHAIYAEELLKFSADLKIVRKTVQDYDMGKLRPYSAWFIMRCEADPPAWIDQMAEHQVDVGLLNSILAAWRPRSFLDTSCGLGLFTQAAARAGVREVYGYELNPARLAKARERVYL